MARENLPRALSIRQPYSEQILRGEKKAEYRSGQTHIRGRVYLYAGKTVDFGVEGFPDEKVVKLPRGLIVGSVEITGCSKSRKNRKDFAWELAKPRRYRVSLKARGVPQPGFWKPQFGRVPKKASS